MKNNNYFKYMYIAAFLIILAAALWVYVYPALKPAPKTESAKGIDLVINKELFDKIDSLKGSEIKLPDQPGQTDNDPFN